VAVVVYLHERRRFRGDLAATGGAERKDAANHLTLLKAVEAQYRGELQSLLPSRERIPVEFDAYSAREPPAWLPGPDLGNKGLGEGLSSEPPRSRYGGPAAVTLSERAWAAVWQVAIPDGAWPSGTSPSRPPSRSPGQQGCPRLLPGDAVHAKA